MGSNFPLKYVVELNERNILRKYLFNRYRNVQRGNIAISTVTQLPQLSDIPHLLTGSIRPLKYLIESS